MIVRRVIETDRKVIFDWRNDELTRCMFRCTSVVDWETHCNWLRARLSNDRCCLLMCEFNAESPIAVVRFDLDIDTAQVSINLAPQKRGKGLASQCLASTISYFVKYYPSVSKLFAEIRTQNEASRKSFEKVGFSIDSERNGFFYLSLLTKV